MAAEPTFHTNLARFLALDLPREDFAIFGSGPMHAHGIREARDVDVVARGIAWDKVLTLGPREQLEDEFHARISLFDGEVEVYSNWAPGSWNIDELIDTAENIDGIRYVQLAFVQKYKELRGTPKDKKDLALIEQYLELKSAQ